MHPAAVPCSAGDCRGTARGTLGPTNWGPCPKSGCRLRGTQGPTGQPQPRDRKSWLQAAATPTYSHILYISCIPWILYIPLQLLHPVALSESLAASLHALLITCCSPLSILYIPYTPCILPEFLMSRCVLFSPCSLLCHLHPVRALHPPLAAHGPSTQFPAKSTHFSLIQGHPCL